MTPTEFGLLGPMLVRSAGSPIAVAAARQRVVLAALAIRPRQVVSFDDLAVALWDDAPPAGARVAVRNHVCRLRHRLGGAGARVITREPGYLLDAAADDVDVVVFSRLCHEGGAAARAGAWQQASDLLSDALRLWRGAPLADVPSRLLRDEHVPGLDALRLQATEWLIEARLHRGGHDELVAELERLVRLYPLRERFRAQLMLALYRCGRQGDALAAYRDARQTLVAELGVDPGAELQEIHQRILATDPQLLLDVPARATGQTRAADGAPPGRARQTAPVPHQLPAAPAYFAGRGEELDALARVASDAGRPGGTVVISAINGTAGVGKTTLAVRGAHLVASEFPDGQLYVNLRGFDGLGAPLTPAEVVCDFLGALSVPPDRIPVSMAAQVALYRTLAAGKRLLIVLDNARDADQVRPLLR